ncbi:4-hydroxy-tetrahydrodipicolinate synthase [Aerobium aerolatum]|uniref:4-hydroxy-tetrahydrodipicolinate synthase n=1 Tax=Aquamicrobium aerolatum DSM 21857 TaxID=1121003 RepID=A0A1I3R7D5_9HYPH|nr:4-hydroxy-tetrahydrodipicolinate synthase [Aquamicrobium aerolatum]SFJ42238.1 4-hydroxy-tetrahydrodipicolinate synthase [Aquamicrobium aerolatum DSM 21857]
MPLAHTDIRGLYTAIVTPFDVNGGVDHAALADLVRFQISSGASGIVPIGGTGEYPALSQAERRSVVETCVEAAEGKPVIPGVLSTGYMDAVEAGRDFLSAGASALMVVTPYYAPGTQEGMVEYFRAYRNDVDLPIMLYQIPRRTGVTLDPESIQALAEDGTAIGMKFSHYDMPEFIQTIKLAGDKMAILSGEEPLFATHMALGAKGGVLASATIHPRIWLEIMEIAATGRLKEALAIQGRIDPVIAAIFTETNPGPLKAYMAMVGRSVGGVRKPLLPPKADTLKLIASVAETAKQQLA